VDFWVAQLQRVQREISEIESKIAHNRHLAEQLYLQRRDPMPPLELVAILKENLRVARRQVEFVESKMAEEQASGAASGTPPT
jgi:hypothetical protein